MAPAMPREATAERIQRALAAELAGTLAEVGLRHDTHPAALSTYAVAILAQDLASDSLALTRHYLRTLAQYLDPDQPAHLRDTLATTLEETQRALCAAHDRARTDQPQDGVTA